MIFNRWRKYPKKKPKIPGEYLCTVLCGDEPYSLATMNLYYDVDADIWYDDRRINVFTGYKVYKQCRAPIEENRVFSDSLCDRSLAVVAWKKMPKAYGVNKRKEKRR